MVHITFYHITFVTVSEPKTLPRLHGTCPEQFEDWKESSQFCFIIKTGEGNIVTWSEAQTYCSNLFGNLASIHSDEEQTLIYERVTPAGENVWIGMKADGSPA